MKKRYIVIIILVAVAVLSTAIGLISWKACTSCNNGEDLNSHTHEYSTKITPPTCTEKGYTTYICECGESYVDDYVNANGHTPNSAERENEVKASCTQAGSYDEVVYCNECGEKLSTTHKTIDKLSHTPKTAVRENEVEATCTKEGSYDEVVRCSVCNEVISTVHKTIDKKEHVYSDGTCSGCGKLQTEGLKFTKLTDGTYRVSRGSATDENIIIPSKYQGVSVKDISAYAFENSSIKSVIIPDSVISIGQGAFSGCSSLESMTTPFVGGNASERLPSRTTVFGYIFGTNSYDGGVRTEQDYLGGKVSYYIPASLKSVTITNDNILYGAFYNCSGLTSVTIGNKTTSIEKYAFYNCSNLANIVISENVSSIGEAAFYGCSGLSSISADERNAKYHSAGNCLIETQKQTVVLGCKNSIIPTDGSVTSIGASAFYDCTGLINLTIPECINSIDSSAFNNCSGLSSISVDERNVKYHSAGNCLIDTESRRIVLGCKNSIIPTDGSVVSIGANAFYGCTGLESITIPECIGSFGSSAFGECRGLTGVYITDLAAWCKISSITYGSNPLAYAHNLYLNGELITELVIPDGVTSIARCAFRGLNVTSVTIPASVRKIGAEAFGRCDSLTGVYITDLAVWCNISFETGYSNPLYYAHNLYLNGELVTELVIPDGMTSIKSLTFYGCSGLTSVTIPDSVTSISNNAFWGCSGVTSLIMGNGVKSIDVRAFCDCSGLTSVYYVGTSEDWDLITIESENTELTNATRYYYSESAPTEEGNYWHYVDGQPVVWVSSKDN